MAEQPDTPLGENATGNAKKGPPFKLIIAVVGALILLGGGGLILKSGLLDRPAEEEVRAEDATTEENAASDLGPIYPLEAFIVNLADVRGKQYLKTKIELELDNAVVVNEIDQRIPQFRDTILTVLSSKVSDDIRQLEGKYQLRTEIITRLNQLLNSGQVTNIYFTEFIVQ